MDRFALAPCFVVAALLAGCGPTLPKRPPGLPPTPATVTKANPGGDAADPEKAALDRLASESWGARRDHANTLRVPLMDWKNWRRVTFLGHPLRAGYRYGDDHHAVVIVWYEPVEGPNDPDSCLARFSEYALPIARAFNVRIEPPKLSRGKQRVSGEARPVALESVDAHVKNLFSDEDYAAAIAAYASFPGTCLVQGFAVVAGNHPELARRIRDRWIKEGTPLFAWERRVIEAPPFEDR
jgi:hypothetical protein